MARPADHPTDPPAVPWYRRARVVAVIALASVAAGFLVRTIAPPVLFRPLISMGVAMPGLMLLGAWSSHRLKLRRSEGTARTRDHLFPLLVALGVMTVFLGLIGTTALGSFLAVLPMMLGLGLLNASRGYRFGQQRVCARCDYDFIGDPADAANPPQCPECGHHWLEDGGLALGRRVRKPHLMWAGIALLVLMPVGFVLGSGAPLGLHRHFPTALLVTQAVNLEFGGYAAWEELSSRSLSPAQMRRLATVVLDARRDGARAGSSAGGRWLDAQMAAGSLPPDLTERYYQDSFNLRLSAPKSARVGETITVRLVGPCLQLSGAATTPFLYLEGFFVDDDPKPREDRGRADQLLYEHQVTRERFADHAETDDPGFLSAPCVTVVPQQAGPLRIRARGWIFYHPQTYTMTCDRDPRGRINLPSDTVWSKELNQEITIPIEPR